MLPLRYVTVVHIVEHRGYSYIFVPGSKLVTCTIKCTLVPVVACRGIYPYSYILRVTDLTRREEIFKSFEFAVSS